LGKKLKNLITLALFYLVFSIILCACGSVEKLPEEIENQPVNQSQAESELISQPGLGEREPSQAKDKAEEIKTTEKTEEKEEKNVQNVVEKPESAKPISGTDVSLNETDFLTIEGSGVKEKMQFSLSYIKKMTSGYVEDDFFSLNNWGTKEYFSFKGVSLWYLLNEKAGLGENTRMVIITAEDGYEVSYTLEEVKRQDYINEENPEQKYPMIIAWEENGKAYDPAEGYPFRFVVGQKEPGDINKQYWVMNVKTIKVE